MHRQTATTITTYALLAGAAAFSFLLPEHLVMPTSSAAPPEATLQLRGTVRDFRSDHPDFQVAPAAGFGHYIALVETTLGPEGQPVLSAGGRKIMAEALDATGQQIAPHLVNLTCELYPNILVDGTFEISNKVTVDAYDSGAGPYAVSKGKFARIKVNGSADGSATIENNSDVYGDVLVTGGGDPDAIVEIDGSATVHGTVESDWATHTVPTLDPPTDLGPSTGDLTISGNRTLEILDRDLHLRDLEIKRNATAVVNGDIRILVDRKFKMGSDGRIVIPDGSRLTIYVMDEVDLRQCVINPDTANPDKFNLIVLGTTFRIDTGSMVCGRIHSPNATLTIRNGSQLYGTFSGDSAVLDNSVGFHMDVHRYTDDAMQDDPALGDTDATLLAGLSDDGIDSATTFDQWFKSVLGVNLAQPAVLSLIRQPDGSYVFDDTTDARYADRGGFFPADWLLFGPEQAGDNNHHFTFRLDAYFVYDGAAGQFLRVTSDSEVWVFVNDELVIDLGGVHGTLDQRVDLDRLCLDDGEAYAFSFFLANRYEPQPRLRFHTNMPLVSGPATASAGFD